jgi:hypothetical protein
MIGLLKRLFSKKRELDIKGLTYDNGDGIDKTAYYFTTFNGWVSMDEPIVFHNIDTKSQTETSLNEWLIKVREGLKIQWWELQLLEDNYESMLDMYWGNMKKL